LPAGKYPRIFSLTILYGSISVPEPPPGGFLGSIFNPLIIFGPFPPPLPLLFINAGILLLIDSALDFPLNKAVNFPKSLPKVLAKLPKLFDESFAVGFIENIPFFAGRKDNKLSLYLFDKNEY